MLDKDYETKMDVPVKEVKVSYASKPGKGIAVDNIDRFLDVRGYKSKADAKKDGWEFK